ncbi:hypothetical protein FAI40_03920 [Acetobacteraceae bacterium]|nr:hypothetical protein FAI40_03920 [Acetobacteraceae bacterium]
MPKEKSSKMWFAAKSHGYGAGLPISWEGWAVFTLFIAGAVVSAFFFKGLVEAVILGALAIPFALISYYKTEGGLKWRRGKKK